MKRSTSMRIYSVGLALILLAARWCMVNVIAPTEASRTAPPAGFDATLTSVQHWLGTSGISLGLLVAGLLFLASFFVRRDLSASSHR